MEEAMRFKRTPQKKRLVEGSSVKSSDLMGSTKSTLGKLSDGLGRAAEGFGKAQDWSTKHFQGIALDMKADLDMGFRSLNMGAANDLADDCFIDGGSKRKSKKRKKKR
jgi:hypothetical protein